MHLFCDDTHGTRGNTRLIIMAIIMAVLLVIEMVSTCMIEMLIITYCPPLVDRICCEPVV